MSAAMDEGRIAAAGLADLASRRTQWDFTWALPELGRLAAISVPGEGLTPISATLRFGPGAEGHPVVQVEARCALPLECQRCLEPVLWPVALDETLTLVRTEAELDALADPFDALLVPPDGLQARVVVEDEILAALPLSARHAGPTGCPDGARPGDDDGTMETHRPFAGLEGLLNRPS
jgi:uncharacterized protein